MHYSGGVLCARILYFYLLKKGKNTEKKKTERKSQHLSLCRLDYHCCSERELALVEQPRGQVKICLYLESDTGTDKSRRSGIWFNPHFCDRDQ